MFILKIDRLEMIKMHHADFMNNVPALTFDDTNDRSMFATPKFTQWHENQSQERVWLYFLNVFTSAFRSALTNMYWKLLYNSL